MNTQKKHPVKSYPVIPLRGRIPNLNDIGKEELSEFHQIYMPRPPNSKNGKQEQRDQALELKPHWFHQETTYGRYTWVVGLFGGSNQVKLKMIRKPPMRQMARTTFTRMRMAGDFRDACENSACNRAGTGCPKCTRKYGPRYYNLQEALEDIRQLLDTNNMSALWAKDGSLKPDASKIWAWTAYKRLDTACSGSRKGEDAGGDGYPILSESDLRRCSDDDDPDVIYNLICRQAYSTTSRTARCRQEESNPSKTNRQNKQGSRKPQIPRSSKTW